MKKTTNNYADQSCEVTVEELDTNMERGLSSKEVAKRLKSYGYNEIKEKEEPLWHRIFRRFWGPIPWMIEIAALLSAIVQKWEDFIIISIMLLVNAGLDFFQEHRALNALKTLKQQLINEIIALRDGEFKLITARELVPGDIIKLKTGGIIPADVQLIQGDYLLIDQAALTGESLPVSKKVNETAFANTIVKQGEMLAVVINTGMKTNFSGIVSLVASASLKERSHFQKMVIQIGNFLIMITLALVLLIIMVSLFRHEPFIEIIRFALVLTVASIPVALPAVMSVTMAVGAVNLARRQAIVSHLTAIEELAGVDIFCSDKTGTLTKNEMQVADPIVLGEHSEQDLFLYAALASKLENNDPIELPLFNYIDEHFSELDWRIYQQLDYIPFDPVRKRTEATIEINEVHFHAIKGAAQVLIELADLNDEQIRELNNNVNLLASKGYRTLAVGRKEGDKPLDLIGLIPLYDPPREDSRDVLNEMRSNGVQVKMLTGDNLAIAKEIGILLGLEQKTIRSVQLSGAASNELLTLVEVLTTAIYQHLQQDVSLKEAKRFATKVMDEVKTLYDTRLLERQFIHSHESAIIEMIEDVDIFAEVIPEDKYRIVDTLQKGGHIVAMTGDGVNDAPALRKADCGFAVSNATDAARAAADIVLTTQGLSVINEAIRQARITFSRMKSYATFRVAETIRIVLFIALSIIVFDFYPITALMIILLALLNDIPILAIAYDNTKVHSSPARWDMRELITVSSILGFSGVVFTFVLFYILKEKNFTEETIQSIIFLKLIVAGHSTLYITRVEDWFWKRPWPSPILFFATFGTEVVATLLAVYGFLIAPIGWKFALLIWGYALVEFLFNDMLKLSIYRMLKRKNGYVKEQALSSY
jgi:H+-transporting ATPase